MKQYTKNIAWAFLFASCALVAIAAEKMMSVQSEKAAVRATPGPFAPIVTTLAYTDQVTALGEQGAWTQIRTSNGITGWMQTASISKKKIVLQAGASDVSKTASGEEIALAGKGFNSKVEGQFKTKNPKIDFHWIDAMEKLKVPEAQLVQFLREGELKGGDR